MKLAGKRIIVTGGARGIGASIVRAFAAEGADVASLDLRDDLGKAVVAEACKAGPGRACYYHCDISKRPEVQTTFDAAVDSMGGLDAMVNVAGVARMSLPEDITDEEWDLIINTNARSTMLTNQAAFKHMREHGGRILNFGSSAGMTAMPDAAHYSASKGAVLAWTRAVAKEWAKYGITVNAIAPAMWTPMYENGRKLFSAEQLAEHDAIMAREVPLGGRLGDPDRDLAPVMIFLVGDGARFITGQTICVDGGMVMVR